MTLNSKFDIQNVNPLLRCCNILAILPPTTSVCLSGNSTIPAFWRWYTAFVFLFIVTGSALGIAARFKEVYPLVPMSTLIITDMGLALSITFTNVVSIIVPSICYFETWKMFLENFSKTDYFLVEGSTKKTKRCKGLYIRAIVCHLVLGLIFVYDAYVWIKAYGLIPFSAYIFRNIQYYHMFIGSFTATYFAFALKYRFEAVNDKLKQLNEFPTNKDNITPLSIIKDNGKKHLNVREISEVYATLVTQVSLFNKLFGWQILFTTLSIVMGVLNVLNLLTVRVFTPNGSFEYEMGDEIILLSSVWAVWQMLVGGLGLLICGSATNAAQQTADECFSILLKLPLTTANSYERDFRDEITMLRDLAVHRCKSFSAAGFFTLDYSLLLSIIASVTSYIIVLIQFNK